MNVSPTSRSQPPLALLDFHAAWCLQCQLQWDCLERLSGEFAGQLRIARVDVDEDPAAARRYGVDGVPTLLLLRDGTVLERVVGTRPWEQLRALLTCHINAQTQVGD